MESTFSDPVTVGVVGIDRLMSALNPHSEWGRSLARRPRVYAPAEENAVAAEIVALREVERWFDDVDVRPVLEAIPTIERPLEMLAADETLDDAALFELKRFLFHSRHVVEAASSLDPFDPSWAEALANLLEAIQPGGSKSARFRLVGALDPRLAAARKTAKSARAEERSTRQALESEVIKGHGGRFDIRGRYIPPVGVTGAAVAATGPLAATPDGFVLDTPALHAATEAASKAEERVWQIEDEVREQLSSVFAKHVDLLESIRTALGILDVRIAKVELRRQLNGCWAEPGERLRVTGGRHPRLGESAQPVDVALPVDRATVITGPNMGGKSILLELVGLCVWAAHHAYPVPADAFEYVAVDRLAYVGAEESKRPAAEGLSAFGREVRRVVELLETSGRTVWLFDEFGRGTHPDEGAALAAELHADRVEAGDIVVAATHFPAVAADLDAHHLRIAGLVQIDALDELAEGAAFEEIEATLRRAMDYQPLEVAAEAATVPRDARRIARALGLVFDE